MNSSVTPRSNLITKKSGHASTPRLSPAHKMGLSFSPSKMSASPSSSGLFTSRENHHLFNHNLSSSVLQHSSVSHKIPQADRFPPIKVAYNTSRSYNASPSALSLKSTTLGFGTKMDFTKKTDGTKSPGPANYKLNSDFEGNKTRGKTFGLPWSAYESVYQPDNRLVSIPVSKHYPGPGTYFHEKEGSLNSSRITIATKGKMFNENICLDSPRCTQYTPRQQLVESARYKNPTFGFGQKYDFTKVNNSNPGPGAYTPPSFCDKYAKSTPRYKGSRSPTKKRLDSEEN